MRVCTGYVFQWTFGHFSGVVRKCKDKWKLKMWRWGRIKYDWLWRVRCGRVPETVRCLFFFQSGFLFLFLLQRWLFFSLSLSKVLDLGFELNEGGSLSCRILGPLYHFGCPLYNEDEEWKEHVWSILELPPRSLLGSYCLERQVGSRWRWRCLIF